MSRIIKFLRTKIEEEFGIRPEEGKGLSLERLSEWKPSAGIVAAGFVFLLVLTVIPLLRISLYTLPWYDDFGYGRYVKMAVEAGGSVFDVLAAAGNQVRVSWQTWQGTYSSIFFMALMPGAWGERFYFIGPMLLVLLPVVGVFALVGVLCRDVCGFKRVYTLALQAAVSTMVLMFIYEAKHGFFWYNGGVHYVGLHSFLMLFIAAAVKMLRAEKKSVRGLLVPVTMLGAFVVAGGNFVTTLQGLLLILTVVGGGILCRNKRFLLLLPSVLVYAAGFCMNVFAPGNDERMGYYVGWGYGCVEAVLRSFLEAFLHLKEFTGLITLASLLLLAPIIRQMVRRSAFEFRMPGLVLAWSVCLYATGFTPSLYVLGSAGLSRTLNAVKITYQLLLVLNEVYWLGYLCRRQEKRGKKVPDGRCYWRFYPIMGMVMYIIFANASNPGGNYSAYGAYYYVHTGEAYNYYQEQLANVEILKSDEKNVVLRPYNYKPWFLWMGDLSDDPSRPENGTMATWYGKASVVCLNEDEE